MTLSLPNLRYERKFVAAGFSLGEILARVRRHPAAFREVYPPRIVNNIYLDSPHRRDYHDHVNGAAHRTKTRVRWYGPGVAPSEPPRLERKLKQGTVSGKETHALAPLSIRDASLSCILNRAFDSTGMPPALRSGLRHLEPALFNRYHRRYFASADGRFRLTVDSGLEFAGVVPNRWPALRPGAAAAEIIVELKFGVDSAEAAAPVTNAFPFRLTRFSKYVAGMERL